MKNAQGLLNRLEAQARLDLEAEKAALQCLERLVDVVRAGSVAELESATLAIKSELESGQARALRRRALIESCAQHFGIAASLVTLGSLCERLGPPAAKLLDLRTELRAVAANIAHINRKLTAAIRLQRRIINDALAILLSDENGNPVDEQGTLINAEV